MFREFFWTPNWKTLACAWFGLGLIVGYSILLAVTNAKINEFFGEFYDLLGGGHQGELGSGDLAGSTQISENSENSDKQAQVHAKLWEFFKLVLPLITLGPASRWIRSVWAFAWRKTLMTSYLQSWRVEHEPVEGASQRLHEDTQRFCAGLQGCVVVGLDALCTLVVFTPVLCDLSRQIHPGRDLFPIQNVWLWFLAFLASVVGLGGAVIAGSRLVGLEVDNQILEAVLRKDLVLLETTPSLLVGSEATSSSRSQTPEQAHQPARFLPGGYFATTIRPLEKNYMKLYLHFGFLNTWLSAFEQLVVLFPYMLVAPLIFAEDPANRISLGVLIKVSNAFSKVFSAFSVLADGWGEINDFRATFRRLKEFETQLYVVDSSQPSRTWLGFFESCFCLCKTQTALVRTAEMVIVQGEPSTTVEHGDFAGRDQINGIAEAL